MNDLLREFVATCLTEGRLDDLKAAFEKYPHDGTVFFHFSDPNKLGINPRSEFDTPIGIYGYPLKSDSFKEFMHEEIPFATDRQFIHFFRPRRPDRVVVLQSLDDDAALELVKHIAAANRDVIEQHGPNSPWRADRDPWSHLLNVRNFIDNSSRAHVRTPGGRFWFYTWKLADGNAKLWNRLFRRAGITGVVDEVDGIIHENEIEQAVFFSLRDVELLGSYDNVPPTDARKITSKREVFDPKKIEFVKKLQNALRRAHDDGLNVDQTVELLQQSGLLDKSSEFTRLISMLKNSNAPEAANSVKTAIRSWTSLAAKTTKGSFKELFKNVAKFL